MTTRDIGYAVLRLLGLFYAISAVTELISMFAFLSISGPEAGMGYREMAGAALARVVVFSVIAFVCFFLTYTLASWLFGDDEEPTLELSAPDRFLSVGVVLIGVLLLASNLAESLQVAAELFWNLEGSRRDYVGGFLAYAWTSSASSIGSAIVGAVLVVRAERIARWLLPPAGAGKKAATDEAL